MAEYRVFWIGEDGKVIATSDRIKAPDDEYAERQATALADGDHVELWQGMRMVARINPKEMPKLDE